MPKPEKSVATCATAAHALKAPLAGNAADLAQNLSGDAGKRPPAQTIGVFKRECADCHQAAGDAPSVSPAALRSPQSKPWSLVWAMEKGEAARRRGAPRWANPFKAHSGRWEMWDAGWHEEDDKHPKPSV